MLKPTHSRLVVLTNGVLVVDDFSERGVHKLLYSLNVDLVRRQLRVKWIWLWKKRCLYGGNLELSGEMYERLLVDL